MIHTIGVRAAEQSLQLGKIYRPKPALDIGLVDELVNANELEKIAEQQLEKWTKIPSTFTRKQKKKNK